MYDWDDVRYMLGDARHYVQRVWAAPRSQAKYRVYQHLAECFNDGPSSLRAISLLTSLADIRTHHPALNPADNNDLQCNTEHHEYGPSIWA